MFFKRQTQTQDVKAGSVYRRVHRDNIVQIAKVVSVGKDCYGIPHVHFRLCYERPNRMFLEDARILALESFTREYCGQASH